MAEPRAVKDAEPEPVSTESWDAFWAEVQGGERATETIRGVVVPVPADLPLGFQQRMRALQDSERDEDVRELVGLIFGEGVLDQWIEAGMGALEFAVVCGWGFANGSGRPTTFREAYEMVTARVAEGKAPSGPNRAARRAATRSRSSATGGRSKRTSNASTASGRATSRT